MFFCVVFELDPRSAVRNDLPEEVGACSAVIEEHAGRAVQLADNHALGAVDDERAVLGHQRNFAEVDFLLLDVANGLVPVSASLSKIVSRMMTFSGAE